MPALRRSWGFVVGGPVVLSSVLAGAPIRAMVLSLCSAPAPQAAYYLFQFEEWGYTLREVESLITAHAMKDSNGREGEESAE